MSCEGVGIRRRVGLCWVASDIRVVWLCCVCILCCFMVFWSGWRWLLAVWGGGGQRSDCGVGKFLESLYLDRWCLVVLCIAG